MQSTVIDMRPLEYYTISTVVVYLSTVAGCAGGVEQFQPGGTGTGGTAAPSVPFNLEACGDGVLNTANGELCDDANTLSGDGCNSLCLVEADWICPTPGQPCVFNAVCGDGILASVEACDDANNIDGDGCRADCSAVETGWQCRVPGQHCVPFCGDQFIVPGAETCDDGNTVPGDGCSPTCLMEPGWSCSGPGPGMCVQSVCGNGAVESGEACDLGAQNGLFYGDGSGCSKTCTAEPNCRDAAGRTVACETRCGDGNVDAGESCDDGNGNNGDGCSALCENEMGFECVPDIRLDTQPCSSTAGECLVIPIIYRDFDGEHVANTGHPDFFSYLSPTRVCVPNSSGLTDTIAGSTCPATDSTDLCSGLVSDTLGPDGKPVINPNSNYICPCRFTDWDNTGKVTGSNGTQCWEGTAAPFYLDANVQVIQSADSFNQWYHDSAASDTVHSSLELAAIASGAFQYSSSNGLTVYDDIHAACVTPMVVSTLTSGFFPPELEANPREKLCNLWPYWVDGLQADCAAGAGHVLGSQWDERGSYDCTTTKAGEGGPVPAGGMPPIQGMTRNFYFTTEARYLFRYEGGAQTLSFFGDDDVWVFVNGKLVLDLGAPHERLEGTVTLEGDNASYVIHTQQVTTGAPIAVPGGAGTVAGLGLVAGGTYEIAVFHADRHPRESNYQLTLFGFNTTRSLCQPHCGDGLVALGEECDNGEANADGLYGGCTTNCKFGPFCGDGAVNGEELCDLGRENGLPYNTQGPGGCTTACTPSHYCGDGIIDSRFGEECDLGPEGDRSLCTNACTVAIQ